MIPRPLPSLLFLNWASLVAMQEEGGLRNDDPVNANISSFVNECLAPPGLDGVFIGQFLHEGMSIRGLGATVDVEGGEHVICVKNSCHLGRVTDMQPWKSLLLEKVELLNEFDDHFLNTILLAEQLDLGDESFWGPWLDTLPSIEDLRQFHPSYLDSLHFPESFDFWNSWNATLQQMYNQYSNVFQNDSRTPASWRNVHRAFVLSVARSFVANGFVPLVDLANVVPAFNTLQSTGADGAFCLTAKRDIKAGEEVTCDYGADAKDPYLFYQMYGFALPTSAHLLTDHAETCEALRHVAGEQTAEATSAEQFFKAFFDSSCRVTAADEL